MQIQEMLRTERITREAAITHEIETYNQLVTSLATMTKLPFPPDARAALIKHLTPGS